MNDARSGCSTMSLSATREKPSTDDPSKCSPLSITPSTRDAGTMTFLTIPAMSVNQSVTKRTPCCAIASSTVSLFI